ncbi:MAG: NFACT family protein [Oscillospiraceae bacterium]|nr:NFACT family protein [Oscillospiraceae bacterium]
MSLDGAFLHITKREIAERIAIGTRIDKISQPSRDEVVLTFRKERLLLSANASSARVCLTESNPENPATPPMFCILLRKHLLGGKLEQISQEGLERALNFDFACTNEIGDEARFRLVCEVMGRTSNIILVNRDTGRIVDAIKRWSGHGGKEVGLCPTTRSEPKANAEGERSSSSRLVLPGLEYEPPPRDNSRLCLLNDSGFDSGQLTIDSGQLIRRLEGVSPIFVREAEYVGVPAFLRQAHDVLVGNVPPEITLVSEVSELGDKPRDFCFMPITQYGNAMQIKQYESANALLDSFFAEKAASERLKQRSGNIMKSLNADYERLLRKIENRRLELEDCKDKERFRIFGDLVNAHAYNLVKGERLLTAEDYETGEQVKIPLEPRLTPTQNAQKYYAKYRKLSTAQKVLTTFLSESEAELAYLDSVIDAASRAVSDAEIEAIREELGKKPKSPKSGSKLAGGKKVAKPKTLAPLKFALSDGSEVLVGRNNRQNDELTFKTARPDDIWLHTKDIAGSHVILRCGGYGGTDKSVPFEIIEEAAVIAARHSRGSESSRVPVDYCFARYVKKPSGSKPGFVIFTHNKTLYVNPRG